MHDHDRDAGARVHARWDFDEPGRGVAARGARGADGKGGIGRGGEKGEETCGYGEQRHRCLDDKPVKRSG
jgi:hypothetical protein